MNPEKALPINLIVEKTVSAMKKLLNKEIEGVVSVNKEEKGWTLIVEALEKKLIPDKEDILGRYEVHIDSAGNIYGYRQIETRRRNQLKEVKD